MAYNTAPVATAETNWSACHAHVPIICHSRAGIRGFRYSSGTCLQILDGRATAAAKGTVGRWGEQTKA